MKDGLTNTERRRLEVAARAFIRRRHGSEPGEIAVDCRGFTYERPRGLPGGFGGGAVPGDWIHVEWWEVAVENLAQGTTAG